MNDHARINPAVSQVAAPAIDLIDSIYDMVDKPVYIQKLFLGMIRCLDLSDEEFNAPNLDLSQNEAAKIKAVSDMLLPHFKKAIEMQMTMHAHRDLVNICSDVINLIEVPVALVDGNGRIIKSNDSLISKAKRIPSINTKRDFPIFQYQEEQTAFCEAVTQARQEGELARVALGDKLPGIWFVTELTQGEQAYYLLTWNETSTQDKVLASAVERFNLSKREAEVLGALLRCSSSKDVASELFISAHTVKNHINSLFVKTGTRKQQELIRRVYQSYFPASPTEFKGLVLDQMDDHIFELSDGRKLSYSDRGDKDLPVVVYCHSFTGSRKELPVDFYPEIKEKARWICVDRPGFGDSTAKKDRTFLDFADDLEELLDHLDVKNIKLLGYSLGGVYAMAYEKRYHHRISKMVLISPSPHVDLVLRSKAQSVIKSYFKLINFMPKMVTYFITLFNRMTPEDYMTALIFGKAQIFEIHERDKEYFKQPELYNFYLASLREMLRQGSKGWGRDAINLARPWGFDVAQPNVETVIYQGDIDSIVSIDMSRALARKIGRVDFKVLKDETHLAIYRHFGNIMGEVLNLSEAEIGEPISA